MATHDGPAGLVTTDMLDDHDLLEQARLIHRPADPEACLRARRFLDQALRDQPDAVPLTYAEAATILYLDGRAGHARLLRELTSITSALAEADERWRHRYDNRPAIAGEREVQLHFTAESGARWEEPHAGIDGVLYTPGVCQLHGSEDVPVVLAQGRGTQEFITGFGTIDAARNWVRDDRCTTDQRPLTPSPGLKLPRVLQEERVLSGLLRWPRPLVKWLEWLPAVTFTTDLRYEIFAALQHVHRNAHGTLHSGTEHGRTGQVAQETIRRLAWSPDWDNPRLGGPGTPLAAAYLDRLALTNVTAEEAGQRAIILTRQDAGLALAQNGSWHYLLPPDVGPSTITRHPAAPSANQSSPPMPLPPPPTPQHPADPRPRP